MEDSLSPECLSPHSPKPSFRVSGHFFYPLGLCPPTLALCLPLSLGSVSIPLWVSLLPCLWVFITLSFHAELFCPHT